MVPTADADSTCQIWKLFTWFISVKELDEVPEFDIVLGSPKHDFGIGSSIGKMPGHLGIRDKLPRLGVPCYERGGFLNYTCSPRIATPVFVQGTQKSCDRKWIRMAY